MTEKNSTPSKAEDVRAGSDKARTMIMDAAVEFLWDHPYRELTAGKLMEQTGLSRPAFYQYFKNVQDLIQKLLLDLQTEMVSVSSPWLTTDAPRRKALWETLGGIVEVCVRNGPVFRAIVEAAPTDQELESAWNAFMQGWDEAVSARIKLEQSQGAIDQSIDGPSMAHALNRLDAALLVDGFGRRDQADPEHVLKTIHTIWMRSLYCSD